MYIYIYNSHAKTMPKTFKDIFTYTPHHVGILLLLQSSKVSRPHAATVLLDEFWRHQNKRVAAMECEPMNGLTPFSFSTNNSCTHITHLTKQTIIL